MINTFADLFAYWQKQVDAIDDLLKNPYIADSTKNELKRDKAQYEQTAHQVKTLLDRQSTDAARELTAAQEDESVRAYRAKLVAAMELADKDGRYLNAQGCQQAISALDFTVAALSQPIEPQGAVVGAEDIAVLRRLKAALPTVGLNGWFVGVQTLERVIAALPVAVGAGECERSREPVAERVGDMGEGTKLQLFREDDGDFIVSVMPAAHRIPDLQVQFCVPGSGGGSSRHTWDALCALHAAMHADSAPPATPAGKGE